MKRSLGTLTLAVLALAVGCHGCRKPGATPTPSAGVPPSRTPVNVAPVDAGPPPPYERKVPKLPPLPEQANLALIFLGYDKAPVPWMSAKAKKRTRADSKALADKLVAEARRGADFDKLARANSDWPTVDRSGSLFGLMASGGSSSLAAFDSQIFALKTGEVSEPLSNAVGFYIVKRLPVVRVAHISINLHDGRSGPPARTHDEAKALAEKISGELKNGASFGDEAFRYSDDIISAGREGVIGALDPRTASFNPLYKIANGLKVGEISAPAEVPIGYEIVKRLE